MAIIFSLPPSVEEGDHLKKNKFNRSTNWDNNFLWDPNSKMLKYFFSDAESCEQYAGDQSEMAV